MSLEQSIYKIINKSNTSVKRGKKNETLVKDSSTFRGMPTSEVQEIMYLTDEYTKQKLNASNIPYSTVDSVIHESERKMKALLVDLAKPNQNAKQLFQNLITDSYANPVTDINSTRDPTAYSEISPNIHISPFEAASIYSQRGLAELVVNKKSKSILLNGLKIKNAKLTAKQIDEVSLNAMRRNFPKILSDILRDSLVFGGALQFPMFKKDSPATTALHLTALINNGIVGKDCIDYFVGLDRWNVVHLPFTNPTQKDYLDPEKYYVPYLGADVHRSRCSRIVTGAQAGFWGSLPTLGWGLSDYVGYLRSMQNYKIAVQTLPLMIQQMSIIARSIDVTGVLASEGVNALDELTSRDSIRYSEWSPSNPVTLDIFGQLQVINRQFAHVPELLRLLRQDFASDTTIPEPMLFSSEKGNFSSGDDTEGNLSKQNESLKYGHKDVETQLKRVAQIMVIDSLGVSDEIIKALPYTEIHFDTPVIANSVERSEIGKNIADTFFQYVAGQMPVDKAASLASAAGGDELSIDSDLLDDLKKRQIEADARVDEKHKKEMEILQKQIDTPQSTENNTGIKTQTKKKDEQVHEHPAHKEGYTPLEQRQHEKTRLGGEKRKEQLAKHKNKLAT